MATARILSEITLVGFLIVWLITLFFTLTILIIIITHWRTHFRSTINLLTCNSSIALLLFLISLSIQIPSVVEHIYYDVSPPDATICRIYACLGTFSVALEIYSFLIQAISCFFITILYKHKYLLTYRTNWILIIISWIMAGIFACGLLISPLAYQYEPNSLVCTLSTKNFLTSFLAFILLNTVPLVIITVLYGIMLYRTARHTRINPNSHSTLRAKRNKAVFKRILLFVTVFSIAGIGPLICTILDFINYQTPWPLYPCAFILLSMAFLINSIAFVMTDKQLKEIFIAKLTCRRIPIPNIIQIKPKNRIGPTYYIISTPQPLPVFG